ncbi:MAG: DUF5103 domain-containing protein [Muribaculaceae bacterium]|nr:DUF5103 domain-containing protein [Muribaculaceae bacterium]
MLYRIPVILAVMFAAATIHVVAAEAVADFDRNAGRVGCVQWRNGDAAAPVPVVMPGVGDSLRLVFDLLAPDGRDESWMPYLRCRVRHKDADWRDDGLIDSEFVEGFNVSDVGYGESSVLGMTTVMYRNYSVTVPPDGMRLSASGNYVLEVFEDGEPEKVIISAPFSVAEGSVTIGGSVTGRADADWNGVSQQLEIEIGNQGLDRRVSMDDLRVDILQNGSEFTRRTMRNPSFVSGGRAVYSHRPELMFKGGNEYRRMETVSRRSPGMHVAEISWEEGLYHEVLLTDQSRCGAEYSYDLTQGGEFTIREADESMTVPSDTEADYTVVHFALEGAGIMPPDMVFVDGALTGRKADDASAMEYDAESGVWHKALLLKQGAYDYRYLVRRADTGETGCSATEGDHHQTQNVYAVYVYYRVPGERTDRLAGARVIKSLANR